MFGTFRDCADERSKKHICWKSNRASVMSYWQTPAQHPEFRLLHGCREPKGWMLDVGFFMAFQKKHHLKTFKTSKVEATQQAMQIFHKGLRTQIEAKTLSQTQGFHRYALFPSLRTRRVASRRCSQSARLWGKHIFAIMQIMQNEPRELCHS